MKTNEPSEWDQWGQEMGPKNPNSIRLVLQNIGGIDVRKQGSVKLAALQEFMTDNTVDIAALTKCNVGWKQINPKLWPQEQTKFWWENSHWLLAYNRQDPDATPYQPDGVGILVVNQLLHQAQCPGNDIMGLGRWCWACLRGKQNQFLRVISAYWPCKSNGPLSTYQQQMRFWSTCWMECCPRDQFLLDLKQAIRQWQDEGNFIILLANMNEDILSKDLQKFCQELQLVEAISSLYRKSPIPTHQRGRQAIDGIFISGALMKDVTGGILPLGMVMASDHHAIWLDICAEIVEMQNQDPVQWPPACRRLKCHDPQVINKYLFVLSHELEIVNTEECTDQLASTAETSCWMTAQEMEYNHLDQDIIMAKLKVERLCQKIHAGNIPWTPALTQAIQHIMYWKGMMSRQLGNKISTTVLKW